MSNIKYSLGTTDVQVIRYNPQNLVDVLPPQVYTLSQDPVTGAFYLTKMTEKFMVSKTYGDVDKRVDKIFRAFTERCKNTGIMATGDKGSGKSLLTQLSANKAIEMGMPVVFISETYFGDAFENFMGSLGNVMVVFDEFAKVYKDSEGSSLQEKVLTLFDGATTHKSKTKCLIFIVENHEWHIDEFFKVRTGRIFYHFKYGKISTKEVREYCKDKKVPEATIKDIVEIIFPTSKVFGYDLLSSIVEESLRYPDELPSELVRDMNIDIGNDKYSYRLLGLYFNGKQLELTRNATSSDCYFYLTSVVKKKDIDKKYYSLSLGLSQKTGEKDDLLVLESNGFKLLVKKELVITEQLAWGQYEKQV